MIDWVSHSFPDLELAHLWVDFCVILRVLVSNHLVEIDLVTSQLWKRLMDVTWLIRLYQNLWRHQIGDEVTPNVALTEPRNWALHHTYCIYIDPEVIDFLFCSSQKPLCRVQVTLELLNLIWVQIWIQIMDQKCVTMAFHKITIQKLLTISNLTNKWLQKHHFWVKINIIYQ